MFFKRKKLTRKEVKELISEIYPIRNESEENKKLYQNYINILNQKL